MTLFSDPIPPSDPDAIRHITRFLTGCVPSPVDGVSLSTMLTISTAHMPDLHADLSKCSSGHDSSFGCELIFAYEEPFDGLPDWLFKICVVAREKYNANWIMLDPDGDKFPDDFPVYEEQTTWERKPHLDTLMNCENLIMDIEKIVDGQLEGVLCEDMRYELTKALGDAVYKHFPTPD